MTLRQKERPDDHLEVVDDGNRADQLDGAASAGSSVAKRLTPLIDRFFPEGPPIRFEMWDQSAVGPTNSDGALVVRSPNALRRLLWSPGELGLARAYIMGEIDLEGDTFALLKTLRDRASTRRQRTLG